VLSWRRRWLPGGLLAPEAVKQFLSRPAECAIVWTLRQAVVGGEPPPRPGAEAEVIEQRLVSEPHESLGRLAAQLSEQLGCSPGAATFWVLTGVLPDEPAVLVERSVRLPGAAGAAAGLVPNTVLRLTVPLFATPAQVAARLRRIRSAGGSRLRSLGARTAALLEHVAEHGDDRQSWKLWRRRYGGHPQFRQFRQAIKRAMNVLHRAALGELSVSLRPRTHANKAPRRAL
jgi:hypothetical protein